MYVIWNSTTQGLKSLRYSDIDILTAFSVALGGILNIALDSVFISDSN